MRTRRRALGQHFLRDARIASAIVDLLGPTRGDLVVEIGPGEGALTEDLAARAGRVVALEIDRDLATRLRERLPGVEVVEADARTWDYTALRRPAAGRVLVAGNLPYSASKPILMALVEARTAIDAMALMLQKEVAERVAAAPGSRAYGSLSVLTQLSCDVRVALRVPPGAFRPPPRVDSAVVHLRVLADPHVPLTDERRFRTLVRAAFAQRRKTLANALAAGLALPVEAVRAATVAAGIDPRRRAETLTLQEFARLGDRLARLATAGFSGRLVG
jgi:16S rRNA (adenine1518-N6/adenine1519-N6)-dimethyltransferase